MIKGQKSGLNRYAVGANVYGGTSSAATRGPVDKAGYVERDAMKAAARRRMKMLGGKK